MDGLKSPPNDGGDYTQTLLFDMGSEHDFNEAIVEELFIKAYFYCEDEDLHDEMFPKAWFKAMSEHLH